MKWTQDRTPRFVYMERTTRVCWNAKRMPGICLSPKQTPVVNIVRMIRTLGKTKLYLSRNTRQDRFILLILQFLIVLDALTPFGLGGWGF